MACWRTASVTASATALSISSPRSPLLIRSSSGPGRGRLPTWVVRIRSVLRFMGSGILCERFEDGGEGGVGTGGQLAVGQQLDRVRDVDHAGSWHAEPACLL